MTTIPRFAAMAIGVLFVSLNPLKADDEGFYDLFNGKDLSGWTGGDASVEDGVLVSRDGNTMTEAIFANYQLEFEFRLPAGGNNGIGIHYPGEGDAAFTGMEIQILDDSHPRYEGLRDDQYHGSLYTLAAARRASLKPVGDWNHQRISVLGSVILVEVNGETTLRANLDDLNRLHPDHEGAMRRSGHIALLGHNSEVGFRNIRIREIPPSANESNVRAQGYKPLFDGKSLDGWNHDPGQNHWHALPGILRHTGEAGDPPHLWTKEEYGDFTMVFDWRWAQRGELMQRPNILPDGSIGDERHEVEELDSGVFVRGEIKSQVNLWNWPAGSGEVWGYRNDESMPAEVRAAATPLLKADRPLGEWNRMMIIMKGDVLNVVLNGRQVIRDARLPGVPESGAIGLQHHGEAIDFANLWIKEH